MPSNVAVFFLHECDIIGIEDAYFLDFDKSFGERIDKKLIATCYAFQGITGESSRHGKWFQGENVWDGFSIQERKKFRCVAQMLRVLCDSKKVNTKDASLNKYCNSIAERGTLTRDLEPISFTGEGRPWADGRL